MNLTVIKLADSASGKSTVITLQGEADTLFGTSKSVIYNHSVTKGTCKVGEGEVVNVDMSKFIVEDTDLVYKDGTEHKSYWLKLRG